MVDFEFFDDLELRSAEQRNEDHLKQLTRLIQEAKKNKNQLSRLNKEVKDLSDLELIPVLRKSDLIEKIGHPSSEKQSGTPQFRNLFFQNTIRSSTGQIEGVTVIIFNDYDNVYSVIWSDGTEANW